MMQRGVHALLFLTCSPFLVLCEDVLGCQSNPPTRHRASVHSSPARVRLQYTVKFEVALTPERRDSFLVTVREAKAPIAARRFKELVNTHFPPGSAEAKRLFPTGEPYHEPGFFEGNLEMWRALKKAALAARTAKKGEMGFWQSALGDGLSIAG